MFILTRPIPLMFRNNLAKSFNILMRKRFFMNDDYAKENIVRLSSQINELKGNISTW